VAHDVFISYSSKDKAVADAVCAGLESRGLRCWIAPRDVTPGADWDEANVRAIAESRVMALVFSARANESQQVGRKVNLALERALPIVPFRIEDVTPSGPLEGRLDATHWLDALTPPLEAHIDRLADNLARLLGERGTRPPAAAAEPAESPQTPPPARRGANKTVLAVSVLGVLALAALIGVMAYRWSRGGGGGGGGQRAGDENRPAPSPSETSGGPLGQALHCTPPENYELRCRGGGEMKLTLDSPGDSGRRLLKIRFKRASKPATAGLNPGECAWVDRVVKDDEPDTIIRYVSGPNVPVVTSLRDANKYWGFCASDHGDYFGVLESGRAN
jgi:hypothetical protein